VTLRAHLAVIAAAVLFGSTFVIVKDAVADVEPVPFLGVRFLLATLILWPFARRTPTAPGAWRAGGLCGVALAAGYLLQTIGLQYTSGSISAFITYLLVLIVPLLSALWLRRPPSLLTMVGVVVALGGLFMLTGASLSSIGRGELFTVGCAVAFALHIVLLAELSPRYDTARLNAIQLGVVAVVCLLPGAFLGGYRFTTRAWLAAIYTAIAPSAIAFALQVWGQRRVGPTRTSLLLMIEPVAAAVIGAVAGDRLGVEGVAGAALILVGIAISELGPLIGRRPAEPLPAD
jgi:drug/metabolite transporter (DMT)-like permease